MKIVVDSNRLFAALAKEGTTRILLMHPAFEFVAPEYIVHELRTHLRRICEITSTTRAEGELLFALLSRFITLVPEWEYTAFLAEAAQAVTDPTDTPFMALCMSSQAAGVWTHDNDFLQQHRVKTFTNIDLLNMIR